MSACLLTKTPAIAGRCFALVPRRGLPRAALAALGRNQARRISPFDWHEALRSLPTLPRRPAAAGNPLAGVFRPLRRGRTCAEAGVPAAYCFCARLAKSIADASSPHLVGLSTLDRQILVRAVLRQATPAILNFT